MLRIYSVTIHVLLSNKLYVKLGTASLTGPAENCPIFSHATFNSETVLGFQNSFVRHSPDMILYLIQNWRVIRWSLFLFQHLRTVLVEALLRDTCNARRVPCILLNLLLRLSAVGCTLNELWEQKLTNIFNHCLQQH